ncbi:signal recognition particle receptor subunit alpha, partial [Pseudomonas fluorescens]|uniref:signal recognition particle receptor subunit alpha n=1 Tax=Pseudomonas fluorescens TaxID=294 RepID=UPI00177A8676
MFGSNDDKKTPAAAGEKKSLFGWLRKKPQEPVVEQPPAIPEPAPAPAPVIEEEPAPIVLPIAEPVLQPVEPESEPEAPVAAELPLTPAAEAWLTLPVAEEPVALVEEAAPHVTPEIPAPAAFVPEVAPAPVVEPLVEPAPVVVEPVAPVFDAPVVQQPEPAPAPAPALAPVVAAPVTPVEVIAEAPVEAPRTEETKAGFFARLKQGLSKTSASIGEGMASLFLGRKTIDDDLLDDLETRLLTADVGVEATTQIIQRLTQKVPRKG